MADFAKFSAVFQREFGERVRNKWFVIGTVIGPLFFAALMILPAWLAMRERGSASSANIVIVDATGAGLGERIAQALRDTTPVGASGGRSATPARALTAQVVTTTAAGLAEAESAATALVRSKARVGYLVLDSATLAGRRARYAGRNASSIADVERLREVVQRQTLRTRLEREGLDATRVQALTGSRLRMPTERLTDTGRGGSGAGGAALAIVVAFLLYVMILLYGQNVLRSVLEEKTTRVAEVVIASVRPDVLLAGKVLGVGAVGLLQVLAWTGGALAIGAFLQPFLMRAARGTGGAAAAGAAGAAQQGAAAGAFAMPEIGLGFVVSCVVFFLLGYILYSAMFAAVGAMVSSEQEAQQAAFPVMLPIIASVVFMQVVLRNPEAGVARAAAWFPLTAPIIMPMRMALTSTSALEVLLVMGGVLLACAGVTWIAARIYRVGMLMYGKRPTLPELARWVRQAG